MSETLSTSPLAESRSAKLNAETAEEHEKAVAEQVARIAGKIVTRASASRLSHGEYGGKDAYSIQKEGPIAGTRVVTKVEVNEHGMANIAENVHGKVSETGVSVSAVPGRGMGAVSRGRSGGNEVNIRLEGEQESRAISDVPSQLAELRGSLAQEEMEKAAHDRKF